MTIRDYLNSAVNPYFNITVENGTYSSKNKESYYTKILPDETFSYDISNNKVLANIDEFGTVKLITFYRRNYIADDIPGVWVQKDFGQAGPFFFEVEMDGKRYELKKGIGKVESDLMDNLFPRVHHIGEEFEAWVLSFAPVSADASYRMRAMVYGLYVENKSQNIKQGAVVLPQFSPDEKDYFTMVHASGETVLCGEDGENGEIKDGKVFFELKPREGIWVPVVIYAPGSYEAVEQVKEKGSLYWLMQTQSYFRNMLGRLSMPDDPMTVAVFERAVYQGISAVGMDEDGQNVGSNWGTFPTTKQIWMKDMYYSYLPLSLLNPKFFLDGCLWFLKYGIRPKGAKYEGGVYHSVSNSLTSVMMGSIYYEKTGDGAFFKEYPEVFEKFCEILEQTKELKGEECYLIPSLWISDALSLGKYHTGTNICVWKAFSGCARLAGEVMGRTDLAQEYSEFAAHVKADIEMYMTMDGKFGKQYMEGIGGLTAETQKTYPTEFYAEKYVDQAMVFLTDVNDGRNINLVMHDGEESDTTLIPFYGYKPYDDEVMRNYLKFTMSTENPTYGTQCRGIKWGCESGATFPGYSTGFAGIVDEETMNGEHGYMRELKRLMDLDGSWWWWPYKCNKEKGEVNRLNCCGKCGWASGIVGALMITQILGLDYDGPSKTLRFRPFSPSGNFTWKDARLGSALVDVEYLCGADSKSEVKAVSVVNKNSDSICAELEVITEQNPFDFEGEVQEGTFLGKRTVKLSKTVTAGEKLLVEFR